MTTMTDMAWTGGSVRTSEYYGQMMLMNVMLMMDGDVFFNEPSPRP